MPHGEVAVHRFPPCQIQYPILSMCHYVQMAHIMPLMTTDGEERQDTIYASKHTGGRHGNTVIIMFVEFQVGSDRILDFCHPVER